MGYFGRRHLVALLCFFGMVISYAMRFCLSIALTEMTNLPIMKEDDSCPLPEDYKNATLKKEADFDWTGQQQGMINSAFFWGYCILQVPGGMVSDKIGGRKVATLGVFLTGVFTIISPFAALYLDWVGLLIARVCVGLSQGLFYASAHQVVGHWIPKNERGTWGTFVFSGIHIGSALNNGLSGLFLYYVKGKWVWLFVMYGSIGILWSIVFFFLTYDSPADHPYLSEAEKEILEVDVEKKKENRKTPWKSILTSWPVWAAVVGTVGHDLALIALLTDLPKFMKTVLHFDVKKNGMMNMVTYISIWIIGLLAGILSDFILIRGYMGVTTHRKIGTTIASFFPSLGFVTSVYVGCDTTVALVCLLSGQAMMGFYYPSLKMNMIDLSKNFSGTVGSFVNCIGTTSGVVLPYFIGALTPNNALWEWRIVMWLIFIALSETNLFYLLFASGELQPWDSYGETVENPPTRSISEGSISLESKKT